MIKALLLSTVATTAFSHKGPGHGRKQAPPAPIVNTCNNTCLSIELVDFYRDGWDGVNFIAEEDGGGVSIAGAPDCAHPQLDYTICPDSDGTFFFTAVHSNSSYTPENFWEVFWTATSHNCDGSVANVFTGGFNTSLIMDYVGNEWNLQYWENLWDNEKKCDACGDAKKCKPKKPKKKKKANKKPANNKNKPIDGDGDTDSTSSNSTVKVAKPKPRYGPPAVNLRVTMYDENGVGWWKNNYRGESWYIADDERVKLFHTGTLCDGSKGACNLCLGDGSYTMRFTGEASNFTAWDFCGVTGQHAQELSFHVKKGKCYADSIVSLKTDCADHIETHVTANGVIALSGFKTEFADARMDLVVSNTVADMIAGVRTADVQVVSTTLDSRAGMDTSASFVQDYTFTMSFVTEHAPFRTDGRSYSTVETLVSNIATALSATMSSGHFDSKLQIEASLNNVVSLSNQHNSELLSLEVTSVAYVGSESMIMSTLPELTSAELGYSSTISSFNYVEGGSFFAIAVVGFVAFVGIMTKGMTRYESLPMESAHNDEVAPFEMDSSISPMNTQAVFETDATPASGSTL